MKKSAVLIIALAIYSINLNAESFTLTVDQAVERALKLNLGFQKEGISLRGKERTRKTAWNTFLPTFTVNSGFNVGSQLFTDKEGTPGSINDDGALGLSAGATLSLPLNSGAIPGIKKLQADLQAGLLDYETARKKLDRDVRKKFFQLLNSKENILIQESNKALAQKRLDETRANFKSGLASELDVLSAEVALINLQPTLNIAIAAYNSQLLFFKNLIGASLDDEITLDGSLDTPFYTIDSDSILSNFLKDRADLNSLDQQISSLDYSIRAVALNAKSPTLTMSYAYALNGSNSTTGFTGTQDPWSNFTDNSQLSLMLSWKLDSFIPGSKTDVEIKSLRDRKESLMLDRTMAVENAGMEMRNLINNLTTYQKTIEANSSGAALAQRTYELYEEAYKAGTRKLLDVESAQNSLLKSNQELLAAKYQYIAGLLDLIYAANISMEDLKIQQ